jgi:ABC-type nitrate/sulfonate/bicarbonate transport system substrate-binding protein
MVAMPPVGGSSRSRRSAARASRRRLIWVVGGLVAVAAAGVIGANLLASAPEVAPDPGPAMLSATIRLDGPFGAAHAGEMVALRAGLFEREGLQVVLEASGGGAADPLERVAGGAATIGVIGADVFLQARGRGSRVVAFAAGYVESAVAFYALTGSGIRTPRDFVGHRVGYQPGRDTALIYEALMARLQVPRSQVREVRDAGGPAPLLDGALDVSPGSFVADAYALARDHVGYTAIQPDSFGIHVPGTVYVATEDTVRDNGTLLPRFVRGLIAGWELAYQDLDKAAALVVSFDAEGLSAGQVRFELERQRDILRPLGARFSEFDETRWRALQTILLQQKLLREPLDLSRAVTFEFLREAYRKPITFAK